ncbi:MAG: hypothetical protein IPP90_08445 [Gemmatimonadaceae bacterium]|nr:hypothetical protein [Gemmatimonadaceae bacterium]
MRALPGVGAYTAGAVASFAYEKRAALVDTNVARVLNRVFAPTIKPKTGAGAKALWSIAERLLPRTGAQTWTHNQALMELGALVCSARSPKCGAARCGWLQPGQCGRGGGWARRRRAPRGAGRDVRPRVGPRPRRRSASAGGGGGGAGSGRSDALCGGADRP